MTSTCVVWSCNELSRQTDVRQRVHLSSPTLLLRAEVGPTPQLLPQRFAPRLEVVKSRISLPAPLGWLRKHGGAMDA